MMLTQHSLQEKFGKAIGYTLRKIIASVHFFGSEGLSDAPLCLWFLFETLPVFRLTGAPDGWSLQVDDILPEPVMPAWPYQMKHILVDRRRIVVCLTLVALAVIPLGGAIFYTRLFTRIMIYAIVACSLDLILGYGGMVSFGHAAFVGVGAYTVALLGYHGVTSGLLAWPVSVVVAALLALVIGGISLRTSGVYFIMITLAFAQMLYYLAVSLKTYGGDDGLRVVRNTFVGVLDLRQHTVLYYVVWLCLGLVLWLGRRLVHSRFGVVLRGIKENERRMQALGYATFIYKLVGFVIAGVIAGLAGALVANQTAYVSPALLHWTRSGEIMVMVLLGGMGSGFGPVLGAIALLLAEEILSSYTTHWMILLSPMLLVVVLRARRGLYGLVQAGGQRFPLAA